MDPGSIAAVLAAITASLQILKLTFEGAGNLFNWIRKHLAKTIKKAKETLAALDMDRMTTTFLAQALSDNPSAYSNALNYATSIRRPH
ncbi:uncharacterized protein PG986_012417 [Apiospora aurea]|uniref:Fungal N-terminal domain-containing protein n=1 Tax=Apiospora aurea TaxID=335848 RepID=A0ABR1PZY1_9PEZI